MVDVRQPCEVRGFERRFILREILRYAEMVWAGEKSCREIAFAVHDNNLRCRRLIDPVLVKNVITMH